MNNVTVIVLNYNGAKYLSECLIALFRAIDTGPPFYIVVVDNGSTDNSLEVLSRYPLYVISLSENLGFSAGNNVAIRRANTEYVCLLNNDCCVGRDWMSIMVEIAESHPEALIGHFGYKIDALTGLKWSVEFDPDYLGGGSLLFKKQLLNEKYFLYGDDIDLTAGKELCLLSKENTLTFALRQESSIRNHELYAYNKWRSDFISILSLFKFPFNITATLFQLLMPTQEYLLKIRAFFDAFLSGYTRRPVIGRVRVVEALSQENALKRFMNYNKFRR